MFVLTANAAWAQVREVRPSVERLIINEGGNASFTVVLSSQPTGNVTVTTAQPSNTDVTIATGGTSLTFTNSNWNTPQSITVNAATDNDSTDDYAFFFLKASGGGYDRTINNVSVPTSARVGVTVVDDDRNAVLLSASSLVVLEGTSKNFTARLTSQPSADVTVTLSEDSTFVTLDKTSLTFTNANWDDFQTVRVSVPQDNVDSNPRGARISVSATGNYTAGSIAVSAIDDDTPGLMPSADSVSVTEGSNGSFTVALTTQPSSSVHVQIGVCRPVPPGNTGAFCGDASDLATVSPASLTFTASNYNTGQTVTVTPVDDDDAGDESGFVALNASGGGYFNVASNVPLTVTDDDVRELIVSPTSLRIWIDEGPGQQQDKSGSGTFGIRLSSEPTAAVVVVATKSGTHSSDLTLGRTNVTFTESNWNQVQELTVSVATDIDADDFSATVELEARGGDYAPTSTTSITESVAVTLLDAASALTLSTSSLTVDEGGDATFTVRLASRPSGNVTLTVAQPSNTDVTVDTDAATDGNQNTLAFTQANWNQPQTVTVSAAQDDDTDDIAALTLSITAAGGGFSGAGDRVSVTVDDDDSAALVFSSKTVSLTEGDGAKTFTVALGNKPSGNVTVSTSWGQDNHSDHIIVQRYAVVSTRYSEYTSLVPGDTPLVFTPSNFSQAQTFTVRPQNDADADDEREDITLSASGGGYDGVTDTVTVEVEDDEKATLDISQSSVTLSEGGASPTFTVALEDAPSADVTVSVTSGDTGAVTVSPASLTFTASNYDTVQTVTVNPVHDSDSEDERIDITLSASGGGYDNVTGSVVATVDDDDTAPLDISRDSVRLGEGYGLSQTFTVKLNQSPSGPVTVSVSSGDTGAVTVSPASLTFNASNYSTAQTVTVTPVDDTDLADERVDITFLRIGRRPRQGHHQRDGNGGR